MRSSLQTIGLSIFIVLALIVIGVGFLFGIDNPVPWIMIVVLAVLPFVHKRMVARRFVSWDDSYSVGIESIDGDHKKLLELINKLQTAIYYHTGESYEREAFKELVDYTRYHFEREENLLREHAYPDYDSHKEQHEDMIGKVESFRQAYEKDREKTIDDLTQFLKTWLIDHINGTDQKYVTHLHGAGVH